MEKVLPSLSVFFPCYNDAGTIGSLVAAADVVAQRLSDDYEIIVINDGSSDHSADILGRLQGLYGRLRVVHHPQNRGYGGALRSGFAAAEKEFIFYTDGDAQYDVFELEGLARVMNHHIDVVNGYKLTRHDPLHRVLIGWLYLQIMRLLFNFHVRDVDCDFRLIRKKALEGINLTHNSGVICLELVKKLEMAGAVFVDYPVNHYFRSYGTSQFFNFPRLWRTAMGVMRLWLGFRLHPDKHRPRVNLRRPALPTNPTVAHDPNQREG